MVNTLKSHKPSDEEWIGKWLTDIVVGMPEESHFFGEGTGVKKIHRSVKEHRPRSEK